MRRNFQILLTFSLVIILLLGFWIFTFLAKTYINDEIIEQAKNDNKVIGEQLITVLAQTGFDENNPQTNGFLQNICDEIMLPNGGFICAMNMDGNLVAAPGLKAGMTMPFPADLQYFEKNSSTIKATTLGKDQYFEGLAHYNKEKRIDVVASIPLSDDVRLFVHQNYGVIKQRASQYVKPLLFIGLIVTVVAGMFTFFATNRIIARYESKIEKQNAELKDALEEVKQQQIQIVAKNSELEEKGRILKDQHDKIAMQNKEITDSIRYAKRIQTATLPRSLIDNSIIAEHFILFKPRDIVSGDFYWYHDFEDILVVAAVDCTGHGVPGAFMSMIGITFLNEIVIENKIQDAGKILDRLRSRVISALGQEEAEKVASDGMDAAICIFEKRTRKVQFAGAFNPMFCIRDNELNEFKGDRMPVGIYGKMKNGFTTHTLQLEQGDVIYLFSDGYADQFGGSDNRKLLIKNFKKMLLAVSDVPMPKQEELLAETLLNWQGEIPQVDDILIIGLRIN